MPASGSDVVTSEVGGAVETPATRGRRLAVSTVFFSIATGLSRIAGLVREIFAASYFGVSGQMSAFTIAFQVPNLIRALFADAALQGAFVPVFTELLEKDRRREAFRVASTLFFVILLALGTLTLLFELLAPVLMPLIAPGFSNSPFLKHVVVVLGRILFPTVLILALSGVVVGMLNSFEHFSVPAIAPLVWNLVIIGGLLGLTPLFPSDTRIYAYAIGVLIATVVQFLLPLPWLRGRGGRFTFSLDWRNKDARRVLKLMLPVTIALGLINFSLLINSFFGTLVNDQAPAAIDKAFRIYQLPQGLFSIAIATVVFPTLARFAARGDLDSLRRTMANGMRQIFLLLIPSAVLMAVLAEPITRLVYQRGHFGTGATDLVSTAMFWWSFSLPFQGASLLLSRSFFSLQRPWATTALAGLNMVVNAILALVLHGPFGISGIVIGTVVGTTAMTLAQGYILRGLLGGIDGRRTAWAVGRMLAAAALLGAVSYFVWYGIDRELGRALWAQAVSVMVAIGAGGIAYGLGVYALGIDEAKQIWNLLAGRLGRTRPANP